VDACWSRIGVLGDGSCRELPRYVHCRNCPVYAEAGARLLERPLQPHYRQAWSIHYARSQTAAVPGGLSVLLFRIGSEWIALPTTVVQLVVEMRPIHSLPHRRNGALLGLVNVRGELLVCMSLAAILGLPQRQAAKAQKEVSGRLLVATWESTRTVFPVDEVHGVHRFDSDTLREPPATLANSEASYAQGILPWEGRLALLLDSDLLFSGLSQSLA
jgi:chemotaxis-related protein WspD